MSKVPDWSNVQWHIYEAEDGRRRVMWRELRSGELRKGETKIATVVGVSRRTVFRHLKNDVAPTQIQANVFDAAQSQYARAVLAGEFRTNRYLELVARRLRAQRGEPEPVPALQEAGAA